MAIARIATSAITGYGANIDKPAGLSAVPYTLVATVSWFYQPDLAPTLAGFTLIAAKGDSNGAGGDSNVAIFVKQVSDGSAEPSSYAFSCAGGDWRGSITAYTGVDATTPISATSSASRASGGGFGFTVVGAAVTTTGSLVCVGGGAWDLGIWASFTPSGWTLLAGTGGEETSVYADNTPQSVGTSDSFAMDPTALYGRVAAILYVLQPSGGGPPPTPAVLNARRTLLGVGF